MLVPVKFDDGNLTWFDWTKTNEDEINRLIDPRAVPHFDVFNVKYGEIDEASVKNYYVTYFTCSKSSTGYCAMFTKKKN